MNAVEVCNLALGRIGEGASRPIQSLTEASEAARACNRVFASAMETTLRDFPWAFAQASVALAPVAARKTVVEGKRVSVRVDLGGRRTLKQQDSRTEEHSRRRTNTTQSYLVT